MAHGILEEALQNNDPVARVPARIVEKRGFKLAMEPKVSMADGPTDLDQVVAGQSDLPIGCHWECLHTRTLHNQGEKEMNENTKFGSVVSNEPIQEGLSFEEWKEYGRGNSVQRIGTTAVVTLGHPIPPFLYPSLG